jgi:hypothetical protein
VGSYPSFAFSPKDDAVIIWSSGQIYTVPLSVNDFGERIAHPKLKPQTIPFRATVKKQLAETLTKNDVDLVGLEKDGSERVHALKEMSIDKHGTRAVLQAAGVSTVYDFTTQTTSKVPVLNVNAPYYTPSFIPNSDLVIHVRWDDKNFSSFEIADLETNQVYPVDGLPYGRFRMATVSEEISGGKRRIAFAKTAGDLLTGTVVATASPGLYVADIVISPEESRVQLSNVIFIPSDILPADRGLRLHFETPSCLLVQQASKAFTINLTGDRDLLGKPPHTTLATGRISNQVTVTETHVAFLEYQHVYLAQRLDLQDDEKLWAKPLNSTKGLARLSKHGGHDLTWSADGKKVFWLMGMLNGLLPL